MSVRQSLLALLEQGPMYGYQLRAEFEQRTGATWPLNVGQVYTTLARLERDGRVAVVDHGGVDDRVEENGSEEDSTQESGGERGQVSYEITDAGRAEVAEWFSTPVPRTQPARDELAIKLAIAATLPGVDVGRIVQQQRTATMSALQAHTRTKRAGRPWAVAGESPTPTEELAWSLVIDSLVFDAESEIRWLDHCESRLRHAANHHNTTPSQPEESR